MKILSNVLALMLTFFSLSYSQQSSLTQWKYGDLNFYYTSGLMDLTGSYDSFTVFLTNQGINCETIPVDPHGIGGAWIEIKFQDLTIKDYALGEFWATMSCWVVGPYYGSCQGYLGTAGITAIDTFGKRVQGWINFETDVLGYIVSASGSFDVPYCSASTNSLPEIASAAILNSPELYQNYPNPFNPSTVIGWQLAVGSHVELSVFNLVGEKVATLVSGRMGPGSHTCTFDGTNLASGVYCYQLIVRDPSPGLFRAESRGSGQRYREVKKMLLIK